MADQISIHIYISYSEIMNSWLVFLLDYLRIDSIPEMYSFIS